MEVIDFGANKKRQAHCFFAGCVITWFRTLAQQSYISQQDLNHLYFVLLMEIEQILASIKEV